MKPDIERGQEFMKKVVKAALSALFAIGVKSPQNIDKFIEHFNEELMKNYPAEPVVEPSKTIEPAPNAPQSPTTASKEKVDIDVPVKKET